MTVSSSSNKAGPYEGNGSATSFAFTFKVFAQTDLRVIITDADGLESDQTLTTDYTVSLNADQNANPGGSVTYPVSGSPLAASNYLTIVREVTATQALDIANQSAYLPRTYENALDKLTMLVQQAEEQLGRTMRVPVSEGATELGLPPIADRASRYLAFDAEGKPIVASALGAGVPVTAFAETILDDENAAAVLTTLGVSPFAQTLLDDTNAKAAKDTLRLQVAGVAALRALTVVSGEWVYLTHHTSVGDGGHGEFRGVTGAAAGTYVDDDGMVIVPTGGDGSAAFLRVYSDHVNVKWFGAVGDGAADDHSACQAAIDFVESLNQKPEVFFPAGKYAVSAALRISDPHVRLRGAGPSRYSATPAAIGGTAIIYTGAAMADVPVAEQTDFLDVAVITVSWLGRATSVRGVQVRDLGIHCGGNAGGIYFGDKWSGQGLVENVYIHKPTHGVYCHDEAVNALLHNVYIHGASLTDITLGGGAHGARITECGFFADTVADTKSWSVRIGHLGQCSNVVVDRCTFDGNYTVTQGMVRVYNACKGFTFTNNYIELKGAGVAECLKIDAAIGSTITGNRFTGFAGATAYAIELLAAVKGAHVSGNYYSTFSGAGLLIASGASRVVSMGNGAEDATPLVVDGNTTANNNFIYEEQAFTPGLTFGGGSTGMAGTFSGKLTQIGRAKFFTARVALTAKGSSTGNAFLTGLPIASAADVQQVVSFDCSGGFSGLTGAPIASIGVGATTASLKQTGATGSAVLTHAVFTDTSAFTVSGMYM